MQANIELVLFVLSSLGLSDYRVRIGLRDPTERQVRRPRRRTGTGAEKALIDVVKNLGMNYTAEPGEAAFYGPKIDFVVQDCIGREWQLGTVQLDYNLPKRFELEYTGADNKPHRPVMIHRAPFGSMERFMGILIEHFAGAFPLWLAPEQVRVLTGQREVCRIWAEGREGAEGLRASAWPAIIGRRRSATRFARPSWRRFRTCWWSARRSRLPAPWRCAAGPGEIRGR